MVYYDTFFAQFAKWDEIASRFGGELLREDPREPDNAAVVFLRAGLYHEMAEHITSAHPRPVREAVGALVDSAYAPSWMERQQTCPYLELAPAVNHALWLMAPQGVVLNATKLVYQFSSSRAAISAQAAYERETREGLAVHPWNEVYEYTCS